jgi:cullin 3
LQDKDLFERYYKQHLSKRLLVGRVTNDDLEHAMLSKLKTECGYQFTSKLESMFMDIKTSQETMQAFRSHLADQNADLAVDISVQVLLLLCHSFCVYDAEIASLLCLSASYVL